MKEVHLALAHPTIENPVPQPMAVKRYPFKPVALFFFGLACLIPAISASRAIAAHGISGPTLILAAAEFASGFTSPFSIVMIGVASGFLYAGSRK